MANNTIADEVLRLHENILNAYDAVVQMGGSVPNSFGASEQELEQEEFELKAVRKELNNLPIAIQSIPNGLR